MGKLALKAIARLTHVSPHEAIQIVRHNPLFGEEINIEEELINLEEAIKTYYVAASTLEDYPEMRRRMRAEKRLILKHCFGLIIRMMQRKSLSRPYSVEDIDAAIKKLVRLTIEDARRAGIKIDDSIMKMVTPYLGWSKYRYLSDHFTGRLPFGFRPARTVA